MYGQINLLRYSAEQSLCMRCPAQQCFLCHYVSLCVVVITLFDKFYFMMLVDFMFGPLLYASHLFNPAVRSLWPQVWHVFFFFVWACCHSRWKSSGCWSSQGTKRHNFQTIWSFFVQNFSYCLDIHNLCLEVLAFCTKDSAGLTMPLFLVCVVKKRESDRLELWCGISEQLLHEWQSQGLLIWTWENPGGAGGEETAAAAEPLCTAVCGVRQPSL